MDIAHANPETYRLVWLDPRQLGDHPLNVRHDLGDVTELAESIKASGIVEPLVVVPVAEGHRLVAGHRRNLASVQAGVALVPCIERTDWADSDEEQIVAMIAENVHREAISAEEEAGAYLQLAAFPGWTADEISRRTGRPVERVRTAIASADLADPVREKVAGGVLTLEQAAEIEAFADDPKATARLLDSVSTGYLHYVLADERRKRDRRERVAALRAELKQRGVRVVARPKDWGYNSVAQPLDKLRAAGGKTITEKRHAKCPGHAVFINIAAAEPVTICTAPKDYGHEVIGFYKHLSAEEIAAEAEREQVERQRKEALLVAAEGRLAWLQDFITAGNPPAKLMRRIVELLFLYPADADADMLVALTTKRPGDAEPSTIFPRLIKRTSDRRLPLLALAYVAAGGERNLAYAIEGKRWNYDPELTVVWLDLLVSLGYPLTEQEQVLRNEAACTVQPVDADSDATIATESERDGDGEDGS